MGVRVTYRATDGTEEHGVGVLCGLEGIVGERRACGVN